MYVFLCWFNNVFKINIVKTIEYITRIDNCLWVEKNTYKKKTFILRQNKVSPWNSSSCFKKLKHLEYSYSKSYHSRLA